MLTINFTNVTMPFSTTLAIANSNATIGGIHFNSSGIVNVTDSLTWTGTPPTVLPYVEELLKERKSLIPTENLSDDVKLFIGLAITVSAASLGVMQGICLKRRQFVDYCIWKTTF